MKRKRSSKRTTTVGRSRGGVPYQTIVFEMANRSASDLIEDFNRPYAGVWLTPKGKLLALTCDRCLELYVERLVSTGDFPTLKQWIPTRVTLLTEPFALPIATMAAKSSAEEIDADELAEIEELFE